MKVLALVDRTTGKARTQVVDHLSKKQLLPILKQNIAKEARVSTDEAGYHQHLGKTFAEHLTVNHSAGEYVPWRRPTRTRLKATSPSSSAA
jgi:hypothetical protein